jgi:hypothetical protein
VHQLRVVDLEGRGGGEGGGRDERERGRGGKSQLPVPVYVIPSSSMRSHTVSVRSECLDVSILLCVCFVKKTIDYIGRRGYTRWAPERNPMIKMAMASHDPQETHGRPRCPDFLMSHPYCRGSGTRGLRDRKCDDENDSMTGAWRMAPVGAGAGAQARLAVAAGERARPSSHVSCSTTVVVVAVYVVGLKGLFSFFILRMRI